QNAALLGTLERRAEQLRLGAPDDPRAHILHLGKPVSSSRLRFNRLADLWAAISISVLLIGLVLIILFAPRLIFAGLTVMVICFIILESILRGTYVSTINTIAVILAVLGIVILAFQNWLVLLVGLIIVVAVFLLVQKVRELRE